MSLSCHLCVLVLVVPLLGLAKPLVKMPLYRDTAPVYRHGKLKSHKTAYVSEVSIGEPPQKFTVLFDTGSAQVIVPVAECLANTCQVHKRFSASESETVQHINTQGTHAADHRMDGNVHRDATHVRFGTGEIKGNFFTDFLCLQNQLADANVVDDPSMRPDCVHMSVIGAYHMTEDPFGAFRFDGVIGLGLKSLALTDQFSFFDMMKRDFPPTAEPHFGVYISNTDEPSEISFGGHDADRLASDIHWLPVIDADQGHWQVPIKRVIVNGKPLESCESGECLGIVDTGCTALGVPVVHRPWVFENLAMKLEGTHPDIKCRDVPSPVIEFDLGGFSVTLDNTGYFKKNPLVVDGHMRAIIDGKKNQQHEAAGSRPSADEAPHPPKATYSSEEEALAADERMSEERFTICQPSLVPVPNVSPLTVGKVFVFGEPVLSKYYTVYDWDNLRVGLALAKAPEAEAASSQQSVQV